jgi:hypothetical protein
MGARSSRSGCPWSEASQRRRRAGRRSRRGRLHAIYALVTDALDPELDQLFQLAPADVVPARNALADRLRKAGDRASAARVMTVKRPTPGAWAINQVYFREPELLERARNRAATLQELHAADGVDGRQLSAAVDAQRGATQAVVDAAVRYCEAAGLAGGPPHQRKIFTSVQGWLSGTADEPPGRMTHDLEASGFDAIGSVGLVLPHVPRSLAAAGAASRPPAPAAAGRSPEPARSKPPEPDPRALAQATEQLAQREREARTAVERARQRDADRKQTELELERARLSVKDAERALVHLRAAVGQRESEHARAQAAASEALEAQARAERAVAGARTTLADLRGHRSGPR